MDNDAALPIVLAGLAACGATLCGGVLALRIRDKLHLVLGFSAGAVIGVAVFDLMPEAMALGTPRHSLHTLTALIGLGFSCYLAADRLLLPRLGGMPRGSLGAGAFSLHSFFDGIGMGLAFKNSAALGVAVAVAVLAHDFSDGVNTVNIVLRGRGDGRAARRWLLLDAAAPLLGAIVTLFFGVSGDTLGLLFAVFTGFFLYIGATDLIPESQHAHPVTWTTVATLLGIASLYLVVRAAA